MKLEITKERILEAANKCSTAKETLKTLFPEVFEDDKYLDLMAAVTYPSTTLFDQKMLPKNSYGEPFLQIRSALEFTYKAFWLDDEYEWDLKRDSSGELVLIPTKK